MATVKELRAQAKAQGIKGYSGMKKAELESALSKLNQTEVTEALKTAESESSDEESANKVQKVMDAITGVC